MRIATLVIGLGSAAVAAAAGSGSGLPAFPAVLFTIAAAILLTLLFRKAAAVGARIVIARLGRWRIRRALANRASDVMHDFILPGVYGGLVRIDHAVMTPGGLLCLKAMHVSGVVFGGENDPQWSVVDGGRRRRFLNPLIQNEGRTRALRQAVPDAPVAGIVVFTGAVEFTAPPPKNVIRVAELDGFIAKFVFGPSKVEDWDAVWLTLRSAALTDEASRRDLDAQLSFT